MRLFQWGARLVCVAAGTVAVGVAVNQILNGGVWNIPWLVASLIAAGAAEALNVWLGRVDQLSDPSRTLPPPDPARRRIERSPYPKDERSASLPTPRQLPRLVHHFTDRTTEVTVLEGLRRDSSDLVLISGLPGVGKTALAIHWTHSVSEHFPDGQLYANLHGYDAQPPLSAKEVLDGFLRALDVPAQRIPTDLDALAAMYRSCVHGRRLLILLDNASSAEQIRPLLPSSAGCMTLVTSRSRLRDLVAQDGAELMVLAPLPEAEALSLFRGVAGIGGALGRTPPEDDGSLVLLVRHCGYLPLTIRMAAEHVSEHGGGVPLGEIAAELAEEGRRLDVFDGDSYTGEGGSVTRRVFSWSYQSLNPNAARMFRLISLNAGTDISLAAAAAITGVGVPEARRQLAVLTGSNMLEETAAQRFQFHDLIGTYARELVEQEETVEERHAASRRLLSFYLNTADNADRVLAPQRRHVLAEPSPPPALTFTDSREALAWCESERLNLMQAIDQAVRLGFDDIAWKLPIALIYFFVLHGYRANRYEASILAAEAAHRIGDRYGEAWCQTCVGGAAQALGRPEEALERYQVALGICREIGDSRGEGINIGNIAEVLIALERFDEARDYTVQSLRILREHDDTRSESIQLTLLAYLSHRLGLLDEAYEQYEAALRAAEGVDLQAEGDALHGLGQVCAAQGECAAAIGWYRRSLEVRRRIDDQPGLARTLADLGTALAGNGEVPAACEALNESLALYEALGHSSADAVRQELHRLSE
ncbi:ATP-binding protein [Actinomadura nitritigenes]|uniref:ATP-binding protein n=1 Tax=Actinomadura nitritigenes TaxID=134602 RepID=UPI003D9312CF